MEIPPRARRRVVLLGLYSCGVGNTSACAEKSFTLALALALERKYLRVRGEEYFFGSSIRTGPEIPPRARRRERSKHKINADDGNTSACAEKSLPVNTSLQIGRKYLRVRGEEH